MATRQMAIRCRHATVAVISMESRKKEPTNHPEAESTISAQDLYTIEAHVRKRGFSKFVYDKELDVFRFPEDGRFAFCEEFADWKLLRERRYL
jgi:hypothetical protein